MSYVDGTFKIASSGSLATIEPTENTVGWYTITSDGKSCTLGRDIITRMIDDGRLERVFDAAWHAQFCSCGSDTYACVPDTETDDNDDDHWN